MKKTSYISLGLAVLLALNLAYAMPDNLTCAKRAIVQYYDSGDFEKDVDIVVQDAEKYLQARIKENNSLKTPEKLAIVLDIDDTSLSNFIGNRKRDFNGLPESIEQSYLEGSAPAIRPVLRLYNEAIENHVSVFFISYRPDHVLSYTIKNLQESGYRVWDKLILANSEEVNLPADVYKTLLREKLTKQGYRIILNLGDQDTDLNGGYAERTVKIPNPLYTTSKTCIHKIC